MLFTKELLQQIVTDDTYEYQIVLDKIVSTGRWNVVHEVIFCSVETGELYHTSYSRGATEMCEELPFEYDDDMIECQIVQEAQKMITVFELPNGTIIYPK